MRIKKAILILSVGLLVGCQEDASMAQRKEFAQKKFNTTEVVEIGSQTLDLLVRDQSNQVWRIYVDSKLQVKSAVILFPSEVSKRPFYPQSVTPVEPDISIP